MFSIKFDDEADGPSHFKLEVAPTYDQALFEYAPTALWLEDLSCLKQLLDTWRSAGISDLKAFLKEDLRRCMACIQKVKFKKVNNKTLKLYGADNQNQFFSNIYKIFPENNLDAMIEQLDQLWNGCSPVSVQVVNYSLTGRRMDLQLNGVFLPGSEKTWEQYLISTEDITLRERALRNADLNAAYARQLFEHSPVSLWVFDYEVIKVWMDQVLPSVEMPCSEDLVDTVTRFASGNARLIQVNSQALRLLESSDGAELALNLHRVLDPPARRKLTDQLIALWHGASSNATELSIRSLTGREVYVQSHLSLLPGFESDWSQVLMSLTDITALKHAEKHLAFLNQHDSLTQLFSRSYLNTRINEDAGIVPTSMIVVDINGLKTVNDQLGHAEGDALIQRAGKILFRTVRAPNLAARFGGDEFVILMPGGDAAAAAALVDSIHELTAMDNETTDGPRLSLSIGIATRGVGESLNATLRQADEEMYKEKRRYYTMPGISVRRTQGSGMP